MNWKAMNTEQFAANYLVGFARPPIYVYFRQPTPEETEQLQQSVDEFISTIPIGEYRVPEARRVEYKFKLRPEDIL